MKRTSPMSIAEIVDKVIKSNNLEEGMLSHRATQSNAGYTAACYMCVSIPPRCGRNSPCSATCCLTPSTRRWADRCLTI